MIWNSYVGFGFLVLLRSPLSFFFFHTIIVASLHPSFSLRAHVIRAHARCKPITTYTDALPITRTRTQRYRWTRIAFSCHTPEHEKRRNVYYTPVFSIHRVLGSHQSRCHALHVQRGRMMARCVMA